MGLTLLDVVKMNNSDSAVGLIDEASKATPEVRLGAARPVRGIDYKTLVLTAVPTGSAFRSANEGVSAVQGTWENRTVECYIFNKAWFADKAVADGHEDGWQALLAQNAAAVMSAGLQDLAAQFYKGTSNETAGFPGIKDAVDSTMLIDGGASSGSTCSSVYAVRWGDRDVRWVIGNNGSFEPGEVTEQRIADSQTTAEYFMAYYQEVLSRIGLQIGSKYSVGRIKNLDDSSNTLADSDIDKLLETFPAGKPPTDIYMTRRSLRQLKNSRTAYDPMGRPAEWPSSVMGPEGPIAIHVTEALTNTETAA